MNKNYGIFGAAIQTAKGTANATPIATVNASASANGVSSDTSTAKLQLTNGARDTTVDIYPDSTSPKFELTTVGFGDFVGLLWYAALGADTVTGTAKPYTHDITCGSTIPYATWREQKGIATAPIYQLLDGKVDDLKMSCSGVTPMSFDVTVLGTKMTKTDATTWTGATKATVATDGYYRLAGAELLLSLTDSTPVAIEAGVNITSLDIEVKNNCEAQTVMGSIAPGDIREKSADVTASISGTTDSTSIYNRITMGSDTATEVASAIVEGSLQMTFMHSLNPAWTMVVKMLHIPWKCTVPAVDPAGGPFDLSLSTDGAIDAGGGAIEVIIQNAVARYTA